MSDAPQGPGWWQASDGRWYPPAGTPAPPAPGTPAPGAYPGTPAPLSSPGTPAPGPYPGTPAPPPGTPAPGGDATQVTGGPYGPSTVPPAGGPPSGPYGPSTVPPAGGPPSGPYGPITAPPGGYGPSTVPPGPAPKKKSGAGLYVVLALVAFLAIAGTAVFFVATSGGDDDDATSTTPPDVTEQLTLIAAHEVGAASFGSGFESPTLPELSSAAEGAAADVRASLTAGPSDALVAAGSTPALFGGSRTDRVCDALAVASFLDGDASRGSAFAGVLGISAGDVRGYLVGLTPVVLASDTWVTDHGFDGSAATSTSAVLQAGTPVLVDGLGVPRVRCTSGDPLTAPDRSGRSPAATTGTEWSGYDASQVVVVESGDELQTITLVDVESGEEFSRAVGAGQTGDVQVTLQWSSDADLDLHLIDPAGNEIYFGDKESDTGGELDVDVIPGCGADDELHTENVFWPSGAAPSGTYRAWVVNYSSCEAASHDLDIQIVVDGEVVVSESTTVAEGGETPEFTFDV